MAIQDQVEVPPLQTPDDAVIGRETGAAPGQKSEGKPEGQTDGLPEAASDGASGSRDAVAVDQAGPAQTAEAEAWSLWWGTLGPAGVAMIHLWRVGGGNLSAGHRLQTLTAADARRLGLADHQTAIDWLRRRFGAGCFRWTPRDLAGKPLPGIPSHTIQVEDETMQTVVMPAMSPESPADRDVTVEIERLRLQAEMDREREARRERRREEREERRRERDADRDRRREEERKERQAEEARRADREAQTHALMIQVLKEMAAGRQDRGRDDTLLTAVLAKFGQPDPLVLKLLDNHGKREELTDFIKAQAESMRMASSLQTDSLKSVMAASQEVQSQLLRQAVEVASTREGGGAWDSIGSVLSGAAGVITALRTGDTLEPALENMPKQPRVTVSAKPRPAILPPAASDRVPPVSSAVDSIGDCLRLVRAVHLGHRPDDESSLIRLIRSLPLDLAEAIRTDDLATIQRLALPAIQVDAGLSAWLGTPGADAWITNYLGRVRARIGGETTTMTAENEDGII